MKTRSMWNRLWAYSLCAALGGVGLLGWTNSAAAQATISAGTADLQAGQTVAVPITINTGSANVAFFAVTFTVVAQNGAPTITDKLDYATASGVPGPDLKTAVQAQQKLAIGYAGVTIDPPLSGTVVVGNLMVPIPAGATGSYAVQLSKASGGDSNGNKVTFTSTDGSIGGGVVVPTATPTMPVGPGPNSISGASVSGQGGQTAMVPITINTGTDNVAFFAVTFTVVAQGGAPTITDKLDYAAADGVPGPDLKTAVQAQQKLAIGYAGVTIDPPLSGTVVVGNLLVPIPAGATSGSYDVQLSKASAGNSTGGKVTLTGQDGAITLGGVTPPTPTATPTNTIQPPTLTPTNTGGATPTNTPTTKPSPTKTPPTVVPSGGGEDHDGCNISSTGSAHSAWLLIITGIGLVVLRRRHR